MGSPVRPMDSACHATACFNLFGAVYAATRREWHAAAWLLISAVFTAWISTWRTSDEENDDAR